MSSDRDRLREHFAWQTHFEWKTDMAGIHHWAGYVEIGGNVHDAAVKCLETRPAEGAAWFWWNETGAPIADGDTPTLLVQRWSEWRVSFQLDSRKVLSDQLRRWSIGLFEPKEIDDYGNLVDDE